MGPNTSPNISSTSPQRSLPTIGLLVFRGLRLRCPRCGQAPLFSGWFTMYDNCSACGRQFNRDAGYLLGSIYFNYGITGTLALAAYFAMFFGDVLQDRQRLFVLSAFVVMFPIWFFRYARALWISFDEHWDPWPNEEELRQTKSVAPLQGNLDNSQKPSQTA